MSPVLGPRSQNDNHASFLISKNVFFSANGDIHSASLVRLGSATHTVNTDQRRVPLILKRNTLLRKWSVAIPKDPGIAILGYWMLFGMDANGTPSIAKTILITSDEKALEENRVERYELDSSSALSHFTRETY